MKKTSRRTRGSPKRSPSSQSELEQALVAVDRVLRSVRAPWYLFGAQAVVLHGVPRSTDDIDVTVLLQDGAELLKRLARMGFQTRSTDVEFLSTSRVIPTVHTASRWRVDFVLGGPGLEQHFFDQSEAKKIGRLTIRVIRAEHLVVLKVFAGRSKDIEDVRGILRVAGPGLDLGEIRDVLALLQTDIADSTLLPVFEQLLAELKIV